MALPGGRGLKRDLNTHNESYSLRAAQVDTSAQHIMSIGPLYGVPLSVDLPTTTTQFAPLPPLNSGIVVKNASIYVATGVASSTITTALYKYDANTGQISYIPGTTATFSAATRGRVTNEFTREFTLYPNTFYFLAYYSSSASNRVYGFSADNFWPMQLRAVGTTTLPKKLEIKKLGTAVVNLPHVVYLSKLGKEFYA